MSARRCVDILGEKDTWVERHISRGRDLVARGDAAGAAKAFVIAANLDAEGGIPAYQYLGPALHDACTAAPEKCITRLERESALRAALKYLLASEKVHAATADLPVETLAGLLAGVVLERDPHAGDFYAAYCKAHAELEEVKAGPLKDLAATLRRVASELGRLARDLQAVTSKDAGTATAIERAKRTAGGLGKDFEGLDDLLGSWQIRRIRHRVERLVESAEEFSEIRDALGGSGSDGAEQVSALLALAGKVSDEHLKERVEDIERRLLSAQATMLGRQVHSQEHWQYLRELAFKCPVSPLMCCVQRINDTWMVAPVWDGELAAALRQHLENLTRPEQTPIP
jgi:hypothetical protein